MASLLAQSLRKLLPIGNQQTRYSSNTPQIGSLPHLLSFPRAVSDLRPLKNQLFINGVIHNEPLIEQFLRRCFHLGDPELALSTFAEIQNPSLLLQNTVLRCLCTQGFFEDVLSVYKKCRLSGCLSDNFTFPAVLKACSSLGALKFGEGVHCTVLTTGFGGNVVVGTALLDLYARCGQMETARHLFDGMSQPDLVSWNALISGYSLNGFYEEVFEVFQEIIAKGLRPNVSTLASTIPVSTRLGCLHVGKSLHGFAVMFGYFADETLVPALISLYAGSGELKVARSLFDSSAGKNVSVWNSMVCAYTQNHKLNEGISMFKKMLQARMHPNTITFLAIIPSCEENGYLLCGVSLHACLLKNGLDNQISVMTVLLSMYAKHGDIYSAEILFNQMPEKNILSWNSLISAYVYNKRWDTCLAPFSEMQRLGFNPDAISIISVLSSCSELEAILQGKSAHAYSTRKGFDANLNLCNALLAFYCRCCHLSSAYLLFDKMAARNIISWNTLISAHAQNKESANAVALLYEMQQRGVEFDSVTL